MGKFLQTSPMENDGTVCCTVTIIKSFSFVPIHLGTLFISIIRWDSIESESSVALLLSNSIYKAHPPKNITVSKIFLLIQRKKRNAHAFTTQKRKYAKALTSKNGCIAKKVLSRSVITMMTFATTS